MRFLRSLLWTALFLAGPSLPCLQAAENEVVDRIVAIVNNDIITLSEMNQELAPYIAKIRASGYPMDKQRELIFKTREQMLDRIINERLADQEIKRRNLTISEKAVDEAIERLKRKNKFTDEELRDGLAQEGISMETYRAQLKEKILRSKLINTEIKSKIVITRSDIENYYNAHRDEYEGQQKWHLKHLSWALPVFAAEDKIEESRQIFKELCQQIAPDKTIEAIADAHEEAVVVDMGMFVYEELSPQLKEILPNLKAGECTEVTESEKGLQRFVVEKVRIEGKQSLEEAQSDIEQSLYEEKLEKNYKEWIDELRERSHVKVII